VALLAGCGGSNPEGRPIGATLEPVRTPYPIGFEPETRTPQPVSVWFAEPGWDRVASVIPSTLPRPLEQGKECLSGLEITVRLSTGDKLEYGPCRRPAEIEPLRRELERVLRSRLAAERGRSR